MALINPSWLTNPANMIATEHGIPSCILEFGEDVLKFMGNGTLGMMSAKLLEGKKRARSNISTLVGDIFRETGIVTYNNGEFVLLSGAHSKGMDFTSLNAIASAVGDINEIYAAGVAVGEGLEAIDDCLSQFQSYIEDGELPMTVGTGGLTSEGGRNEFTDNAAFAYQGINRQLIEQNLDFASRCTDQINLIGNILYTRQNEAELEAEDDSPIFRLSFGPPKSKRGLFVLSEDGLYYDSQDRLYNGEPIPSASDIGFVVNSEKWKLDHFPSLGGKGTVIKVDNLNEYVDTIFDISKIDESESMQQFYNADHFLEILASQQDKLVSDLTKNIQELFDLGHAEHSAMVQNYRQNLYSVISAYKEKQNKRKKQIEVAVKGPDLFGSTTVFALGEIPVNDFSFLSDIGLNISLERQKSLTFDSGEVEGVVLPIKPKYVKNYGVTSKSTLAPLVLPPVGFGSLILNSSVNSEKAPAISLTDQISTSGLFASYNFLRALTVAPSSTEFNILNPALPGNKGDGQLVGIAENMFQAGLGIPYLTGINDMQPQSGQSLGLRPGYFRVPSIEQFQNLLYSQDGCSMDCWLHIPSFNSDLTSNEKDPDEPLRLSTYPSERNGGWTDYNYYRVLLANENTGGAPLASDVSALSTMQPKDTVKGFLMGFTRDPVITSDTPIITGTSKDPGINGSIAASSTMASSCFFIAPTMSFGDDSVEFIPKTNACNFAGYHKMKIPVSATNSNGVSLGSVSSTFIHLHVSFNPQEDLCTVYLDGRSVSASSMSDIFGIEAQRTPQIPSFIVPKDKPYPSYYYTSANVTYVANEANGFNNGPNTDTYFTPWVVGGPWTEGIKTKKMQNPAQGNSTSWVPSTGGFMGYGHGFAAGLNGHVGSLKFYSRALTTTEVLQNYTGQAGFFKSIDL